MLDISTTWKRTLNGTEELQRLYFYSLSPYLIYYIDLHLERTSAKIYVAETLTEFQYFLILVAIPSVPIRMQNRDEDRKRQVVRKS